MRIMSNNRMQNVTPYCSIGGWSVHFHRQLFCKQAEFWAAAAETKSRNWCWEKKSERMMLVLSLTVF